MGIAELRLGIGALPLFWGGGGLGQRLRSFSKGGGKYWAGNVKGGSEGCGCNEGCAVRGCVDDTRKQEKKRGGRWGFQRISHQI